jgi:hypothetical protein
MKDFTGVGTLRMIWFYDSVIERRVVFQQLHLASA